MSTLPTPQQHPDNADNDRFETSTELVSVQQVSASDYHKLGNRHYNSFLTRAIGKELDRAIGCYKRALETDPNHAESYVKLASALYDKGEIPVDTAITYCQQALALNPDIREANLFLGYFLKREGKLDEALVQFKLAMGHSPISSPKARMAYGRTLIQKAAQENTQNALARIGLSTPGISQFTLGVLLLPVDTSTFEVLQNALLTDSKIYAITGVGRILKSMGMTNTCRNLYEWGGRHMATEPIFFHLLGDMALNNTQYDAALYYYTRTRELDPDNSNLMKKLSKCYAMLGDSTNAAQTLEQVIADNEQDYDAMYGLAQLYTERKEFIRALYYFKELLSQDGENPYTHSNLAYVLFKLEDYDGAIQHYQSAVTYGDDPVWTATVAQTLGTLYHQIKKDTDAAIAMYQMAYQLDPNNLECVSMLAELYSEQDNLEAALGAYKYLLQFEPENADCHCFVGYLLWQLDRNTEAIASYETALKYNPDCPIARNNLGVIYLDEQSNAVTALELFEKALSLKPDYTLAAFNIGRSREMMGLTAEAARAYSNALALNANNPELQSDEIQDRLNGLFQV